MAEVSGKLPEAEGRHTVSQFTGYLEAGGTDNIGHIRETLRMQMTANAGIFRTGQRLTRAVEVLNELKARADKTALSDPGFRQACPNCVFSYSQLCFLVPRNLFIQNGAHMRPQNIIDLYTNA